MTPEQYALQQLQSQFGNRRGMGPQDINRARDFLARNPETARQNAITRQSQAAGGEQSNVAAALETQRSRDLLNHLMQPAAGQQQAPQRAPASGGGRGKPGRGKTYPVDQPKKDMRSNRQAEMGNDERTRPFETAENPRTRLTPQDDTGWAGGVPIAIGVGAAGATALGAYLIYKQRKNARTGEVEQVPMMVENGVERPATKIEERVAPTWEDLQRHVQGQPKQLRGPGTVDPTASPPGQIGTTGGPDAIAAPYRQIAGPPDAVEAPSAAQAPDVIAGRAPEPTRNPVEATSPGGPGGEYDPDNPQGSVDVNEQNRRANQFKKKSDYPDAVDRSLEEKPKIKLKAKRTRVGRYG